MKALVTSALLAFSTLLVSPAVGQDWSLRTDALKKSVFRLEANDGQRCSAVLVNERDGILLTAAHCVPEKPEGRSVVVDSTHVDVVRYNAVLDLAAVKGSIGGTALALRKEDTVAGLPVAIVGYGFATARLKFGFGWVSDARDDSLRAAGDRLYFSAAGVVPGDSGGAVVDLSGRLITIVQGYVAAKFGVLGLGAPTDVVASFVKPFLPKS